jgi:hypothetical protein
MMGGLMSQPFSPDAMLVFLITGFSLLAATIITVTAIVFGVMHSMAKNRAEAAMKREMIARGMSADEIARVINTTAGAPAEGAVDLPCASEAVVDWGGDWCPALVLQVAEGRYLVHYVGHEMDSNEWVTEDRIRFAAGSQLPGLVSNLGGSRNGAPRKEPVEAEV